MKDETKEKLYVRLDGGIGGATPDLLELAYGLVSRDAWTQDSTSLLWFLLGLAGFFGVGFVSAWVASAFIFKDESIKALLVKVFLVGVIISAVAVAVQTFPNLSISHVADGQVRRSVEELKIQRKKGCNECDIWFFNEEKQLLKKETFSDKKETQSFKIPHGATAFGIWNTEINPNEQQLKKNAEGKYHYQFDYERSYLNDLRRGFGRYDIRPFDAKFSQVNGEHKLT